MASGYEKSEDYCGPPFRWRDYTIPALIGAAVVIGVMWLT